MIGDLRFHTMKRHVYLLLAVFAVGSTASSQDDEVSANCPNNLPYTSAMKLFHGTCYQFVSQEKFWQQARDYCLMNGGRLVKVNDPQTNTFIVESLNSLSSWRNRGVWIGLHDITSEMEWQWTGYELHTNEAVQWTNWGRGHPGAFLHSRRDCVRMVRGGGDWRWHETFCHTLKWHYRFICEYKANVSRSVASVRLQVFRIPNHAVNHEVPASDNSMLEGFSDDSHLLDSDEVRAVVAEVQSGEQKAVDDSKKKSSGIIAVAVGCFLLGTMVIVIAFVLYRRRQRRRRYLEDDSNTFSKGKDPADDDAITEESKSGRPRAVANIYVTSDVKGNVTTSLASRPKPDVVVEDSDSNEDEDYDDYDDGEELRREAEMETKEGEAAESPVENGTPKSSNIYFEIPENAEYPDNSHIYEALDEVKK